MTGIRNQVSEIRTISMYLIPDPRFLKGLKNGLRRVARAAGADQGTLQGRSQSRPDHAQSQGCARRHQYRLQGRDRPRARGRGAASGDRRLGPGIVLGRHVARSFGRLRRRHTQGRRHRARHSASIRHRVGAKAISIFAARSASPRTRRSALRRSGCASISIPTPRKTSSISCSSSRSAIAWSIRRSAAARRLRSV